VDTKVFYVVSFHKRLGAGFFGGEGFIMQRIHGDGMAFLHAGGAIVTRELRNEKLLVDRILANPPSAGGDQKGEGSALGKIFRMTDGR